MKTFGGKEKNMYLCSTLKVCLLLAAILQPVIIQGQSNSRNFILTRTMLDSGGTNSMKSIQYYDGLGRPSSSVATTGAQGEASCSLVTYDALGREEKSYLPVLSPSGLNYSEPRTIIQMSANYYNGDRYGYSQTHYDIQNRITSKELPGEAWHLNQKSEHAEYGVNTESDRVLHYKAPHESTSQTRLEMAANRYYVPGTLTKEIRLDADNVATTIFKDLVGNTVLERRDGSDTYYVYNDYGQLRFVLMPEYQNNANKAINAYEYRYDSRGRMVKKILPGCEYTQYWYDDADRLVCTQDAILREKGRYRYMLYDGFGRLAAQFTSTTKDGNCNTPVYVCLENADRRMGGYAQRKNSDRQEQYEVVTGSISKTESLSRPLHNIIPNSWTYDDRMENGKVVQRNIYSEGKVDIMVNVTGDYEIEVPDYDIDFSKVNLEVTDGDEGVCPYGTEPVILTCKVEFMLDGNVIDSKTTSNITTDGMYYYSSYRHDGSSSPVSFYGHGRFSLPRINKHLVAGTPVRLSVRQTITVDPDKLGRNTWTSENRSRVYCTIGYNGNTAMPIDNACIHMRTTYDAPVTETRFRTVTTSEPVSKNYADMQVEVLNYYDNHDFLDAVEANSYFSGLTKPVTSVPQTGQLTGTVIMSTTNEPCATVNVYDIKGQMVKSLRKGLGGFTEDVSTAYTFTGAIEKAVATVNVKHGGSFTATTSYAYNYGKKTKMTLAVSHGMTPLSRATDYYYDAIGRLTGKSRYLTSSAKSNCTYSYDIHGWLTRISSGGFEECLYYADGLDGGCYNGNISTMKWRSGNSSYSGYNLKYDDSNRLSSAVFGSGDNLGSNRNYFNESVEYDGNGNITRLQRRGLVDKMRGGFGLVDNLYMTYDGNQLVSVRDDAPQLAYTGATDFNGVRYREYPLSYNASGSLVSDAGRKIAHIDYDNMNNPVRIQFMDGNVTKYIYSATGEKLRVIYITAVPNISVPIGSIKELSPSEILCKDSIDYLLGGNLTLRNGRIDKYQFEEGYCQAEAYSSTKDQFTFCYYDRDHLGSVRQVTEADGSKNGYVIQTANYYPFGGELCQGDAKNSIQSHKYNGKEFDNMYGLNTYDYGARQYNPVTGRWDRMDPLCEKYYPTSPFAYCMNNPVRLIDPDGRDPGDFFYSLDAAAKDFGKYTNPKSIKENREYATAFYKMTNNKGEKGFSYTKPR